LLQALMAAGMALLLLPRGLHHCAYWLLKASANVGKMSILAGWHYREYAAVAT
jgi:succinoglycan biosynthesis protein ExoM